jgi:dipeptidyl aminopeptidase/acylaminoacyl peptidase
MRYRLLFLFVFILFTGSIFAQDGSLRVVGEPELLVRSEGNLFMAPRWSPDGSMIAFTGPRYAGIWLLYLADGRIEQITDEESAGFGFSWSDDSRSILARVSIYENVRRYTAVKIFDVREGTETIVADYQRNIVGVPQWSAGGENVLINTRSGLQVRSSQRTVRNESDGQGGAGIQAFPSGGSIAIRDESTYDIHTAQPLGEQSYINVTLSPDRSKIAFEYVGGSLHVMNADGTGLIDLGRGHRPQWSPDGEYIVYMITEDDGHNYTAADIYAVRADGSDRVRLTDDDAKIQLNPSWSPDGNRIVYDVYNEGAIYAITVAR